MLMQENINPQEIKLLSEKIILDTGGDVLAGLPTIEFTNIRSRDEVVNRALILNALFQLHLNAPKFYIANWLCDHGLESELSEKESTLLYSKNDLTEAEQFDLYWSLEALWALAWATKLISDLSFEQEVGDVLAFLSPNLQLNEGREKYELMQLRSYLELYKMRDLYYRLHWWLHNAEKTNSSSEKVHLPIILLRRKALEWVMDHELSWDNMTMDP